MEIFTSAETIYVIIQIMFNDELTIDNCKIIEWDFFQNSFQVSRRLLYQYNEDDFIFQFWFLPSFQTAVTLKL